MSLEDEPLEKMYYFGIFNCIHTNGLVSKIVLGFFLVSIVCLAAFGLRLDREDSDRLFINLMSIALFSPCITLILGYFLSAANFLKFREKAIKNYRSVRTAGPKIYNTITRFSRKVAYWFWCYFFCNIIMAICVLSDVELRKQLSIFRLMGGYRILEGLLTVLIIVVWMSPIIALAFHMRWTHFIWTQVVLLESMIINTLGTRSNRDDKEEQKFCKKRLREVVKFHSDIKSMADDYFQILRVNSILVFFPGVCTLAMSVLCTFTDKCEGIKFVAMMSLFDALVYFCIIMIHTQQIIDKCEQLVVVLYDCPWYNWTKKNCVTLIIIFSLMMKPLLKTEIFGVYEVNCKMIAVIDLWACNRNIEPEIIRSSPENDDN